MTTRILFFLFLIVVSSARAQRDIIVTQAGEQIRCKIMEESSMRFTYAYVNSKGKVVKTEIFKTLISSFRYNYYPEDILPEEKLFRSTVDPAHKSSAKLSDRADQEKKETAKEKVVQSEPELPLKEANRISVVSDKKKEVSTPLKEASTDTKVAEATAKPQNAAKTENETIEKDSKVILAESKSKEEPPASKTGKDKEEVKPEVTQLEVKKSEFTNYLKYRFGIKGGLGNIIHENTDKSNYGLYTEKLLRGWIYGLDAAVFLNDNLGLGVVYHDYQSRNKSDRLDYPRTGFDELRTGSLQSKVSHKFVGPSLLYRLSLDYKTFIVASASPGYFFYSDKRIEDQMDVHIKGNTFGASGTLGIDFLIGDDKFGRDVILSFECGYNYGQLHRVNYRGAAESIKLKEPVNLNRLDFSIGLRFTRFPRYLK